MVKRNKLILKPCEIINIIDKDYKKLSDIFSDKFGIVNAILERYDFEKYDLYMFQCLSANVTKLYNVSREVSSGGLGISEDKRIALTSCLAEALERYCMSYIPKDEIIYEYKKNLNNKKTFSNFYTYDKKQYEYNKSFLNPNKDKIEWTKIYKYNNKKDYMYWPASLIYIPYDINKTVAETTSTGMAAGFDIKDCILSGLLELIERDALMINFMQRLNPPEIDIKTIHGKNKKFIEKINVDYNIKIYKLYSDIAIPIFLSIIYKKHRNKIHYGIGACANLDSDYAINKSLKECLFTYMYSLNMKKEIQKDKNKINKLYEHFLYYQGDNFSKLLFDSKKIKYVKEKVDFSDFYKLLKDNKIEIYYKELTTEDIIKTGIRVVKVISPSLIDLNKSHIYPRLGATRFFEVPKKLGLKYSKALTNMPHPFP